MSTTEPTENIQARIIELLPRLRRFARNLTRNPHDADDVVQIAIERALTRLDQWHRDARLDSWLFRIVRNAWIDEIRSRARRDALLQHEQQLQKEIEGQRSANAAMRSGSQVEVQSTILPAPAAGTRVFSTTSST